MGSEFEKVEARETPTTTPRQGRSAKELLHEFAQYTTAHGLNKIVESTGWARKLYMGRFLPELLYSLSSRNNAVVQAIRRQAGVHRDKRQGGIGKDFVRNKDRRRPINRHTIYTGAPRRAFQLPVSHEIELKALTRRLWLPPYVRYNSPCVISEHVEMRSLATTRVLLTPPIECRETRPTA